MTTTSCESGASPLPAPAGVPGSLPPTLADEHMLLLSQVAVRAEDLLAAAGEGRWPAHELEALLGYVRAEVLRQVADEEALLFPAAGAPPVATRLARDHARLRAGVEVLERAAAGEQAMAPLRLASITRDFVCQLDRHMSVEETLLAASGSPATMTATTALGRYPHEWYPLTEGPVIDLDALPADQAVEAAVARLLRLRLGERVELCSASGLEPVWQAMDRLSPGSFRFTCLQEGPGPWRMQVTRREAA